MHKVDVLWDWLLMYWRFYGMPGWDGIIGWAGLIWAVLGYAGLAVLGYVCWATCAGPI